MIRRFAPALCLAGALLSSHAMADAYTSCSGWRIDDTATALPPCPDRPNCAAGRWPTRLADPRQSLRAALLAEPRSRLEFDGARVIVASFRSRLFGFVDEAVFLLAPDGEIAYRSAACSGYYDFRVNRRRMDRIRARFGPGSEQPGT
ncbi:MAG: DUF1499 domain-containing protein [Rhodocyclaceae bacterium]|nr:DUF1499 domain-containing protein [Rhodocyclaceae bacterium]